MNTRTLKVYVPDPDHTVLMGGIARMSGIVGSSADVYFEPGRFSPELIVVDFEGNLYGAENVVTWADRVEHAAGRHLAHYPTIARRMVLPENVIEVGEWRPDERQVSVHWDGEIAVALRDWLGVEDYASEMQVSRVYR